MRKRRPPLTPAQEKRTRYYFGSAFRVCIVCGIKKSIRLGKRMCEKCEKLNPDARRQLRKLTGRKPPSIRLTQGGLPSLGKRH